MSYPSIRSGKLSSIEDRNSGPKRQGKLLVGLSRGNAGPRPTDRIWRWVLRLAYMLHLGFGFVFRPRHRGAGVALWHAGRLLVIKNTYRRPWGVPAGGIRRGESPRTAAVRELKEEVGISVPGERLETVGTFRDTSEFFRDRFTLFAVELPTPPKVVPDRREVARALFADPARILKMDLQPPVRKYLEGRNQTHGQKAQD